MAEIKKWNGSAWEVTYPKTTAGNIVASGTPSSTTFLRGDGTWAEPAGGGGSIDGSGTTNEITYWVDSDTLGSLSTSTYPSLTELGYVKGVTSALQTQINGKAATSHTHGNISSTGTISSTADIASGDRLLFSDAGTIRASDITFGTSATTFLANNGNWETPGGGGTSGNYFTQLTQGITIINSADWNTDFSLTDVAPGRYILQVLGQYSRVTGGATRRIDIGILFDDETDVEINCDLILANSTTSITGVTALINDIDEATSTLGTSGSYAATSASSTAISGAPFRITGLVDIGGSTNKTITIPFRQSASTGTAILGIYTYIQLIRVD